MSTYREIVYFCMDRLKVSADDSYYNEEHFLYLIKKYRASIIQQLIDAGKELSDIYYQTLCTDLEFTYAIDGLPCEGVFLRSKNKIPDYYGVLKIYSGNYYKNVIIVVSKERMKYVGHNKWLQNIIYASIDPDNYLYLTSANPQFKYLQNVTISGIFQDPEEAEELACCSGENSSTCDVLDRSFPLEEAYVPQVIDLVVQAFSSSVLSPEDKTNDANDEFSDIGTNAARAAAQKAAYKSIRGTDND